MKRDLFIAYAVGFIQGLIAGIAVCFLGACENPITHFTEEPKEPREIIVPKKCLNKRDSTTLDTLGRETVNWSCEVGEGLPVLPPPPPQ